MEGGKRASDRGGGRELENRDKGNSERKGGKRGRSVEEERHRLGEREE